MGVLDSVLAYKAQKDAQARADIDAIPLGINAFVAAKQQAQKSMLDQLTYNMQLQKFNMDAQKQPYEIAGLQADAAEKQSKSEARKRVPEILSKLTSGNSNMGVTGASLNESGDLNYSIGETPESKASREVQTAKLKEEGQSAEKARVQMEGMKSIESDLDSALNSYKAIPEKFRGPIEGRTKGVVAKFFQESPELNTYEDTRGLILANISREFGGEKGVLTDKDIERIQRAFPDKIDTDKVAESKITFIKEFIQRKVDAKAKIAGEKNVSSDKKSDSKTKTLDINLAKQFLQKAGGDKNKARELAKAEGYSF